VRRSSPRKKPPGVYPTVGAVADQTDRISSQCIDPLARVGDSRRHVSIPFRDSSQALIKR